MEDLLVGSTPKSVGVVVLLVAVSGTVIYLATVAVTRLGGARTQASVSAFDFIANVSVGAMVGSVIVSPSIGIVNGVVGIVTIFGLQLLIGLLRERPALRRVVDDRPMLVMRDGQVLSDAIAATRLTEADLQGAMRRANVHRYGDVDAIVLEKTGTLSVIHHAAPAPGIEDRLLDGVAARDQTHDGTDHHWRDAAGAPVSP